jgi:NAD(P)-dependent dehydrogenase (short-subunit alcohol dehydrogenase family)
VEQALAWLGGLDVVVSNAGVAAAGLVETFSDQALARIFDVNLLGTHRLMRAVLPVLRPAGRGLLIYVSSTLGRELMPFLAGYGASKFALESYAEGLAMEVGPLGIETCIVQPGTFPTTSILRNLVPADDGGRADGYGPMAEAPGQLFAGLGAMAASGQAPDPQQVADVVVRLVDAPRGQRPLRVAVDPGGFDGAARLNAVAAEVQQEKLAGFGLSHLRELDSLRGGAVPQ